MKILDGILILLEAVMLLCGLHLLAALLDTKVVELLSGVVCFLWAYMIRNTK